MSAKVNSSSSSNIGQTMPDGSIYAGLSPDTGKPFYAAASDENSTMSFGKAFKGAGNKSEDTGESWRLPSYRELLMLYQNKDNGDLQGTFNNNVVPKEGWFMRTFGNPHMPGWYWTGNRPTGNYALYTWARNFNDAGNASRMHTAGKLCVRYVKD